MEQALGDPPQDARNRPAWVRKNQQLQEAKAQEVALQQDLNRLLNPANPALREPERVTPKAFKQNAASREIRSVLHSFMEMGSVKKDDSWLARWVHTSDRDRYYAYRKAERELYRRELTAASLLSRDGKVFRKVFAIVSSPDIPADLAREVIDLDYLVVFSSEKSLDNAIEHWHESSASFLSQFFEVMELEGEDQQRWLDTQRESVRIKEGKEQ